MSAIIEGNALPSIRKIFLKNIYLSYLKSSDDVIRDGGHTKPSGGAGCQV